MIALNLLRETPRLRLVALPTMAARKNAVGAKGDQPVDDSEETQVDVGLIALLAFTDQTDTFERGAYEAVRVCVRALLGRAKPNELKLARRLAAAARGTRDFDNTGADLAELHQLVDRAATGRGLNMTRNGIKASQGQVLAILIGHYWSTIDADFIDTLLAKHSPKGGRGRLTLVGISARIAVELGWASNAESARKRLESALKARAHE